MSPRPLAGGGIRAKLRVAAALASMLVPMMPAMAADRAVWIWEAESYALIEDPSAARQALELAHRKQISSLYLYADAFRGGNPIVDRPDQYRRFVRAAHRAGLRVFALLGSAYLHTESYVLPERQGDAATMFRRVLEYNAASASEERFDGVNLDVEPYILDEWDRDKLRLLAGFLDLSQALMSSKRASGQRIEVGPAIPFWFAGIRVQWHGVSASVTEHVLALFDYAALMDYRDHAEGDDGIISHAIDTMQIAERQGKKIVIGVEVGPGELEKVSFQHLSERDLERELALTERAFGQRKTFGGFAIHDYRRYREWLDRQGTGR
jgi:hypothetical protein